MSLFTPAALTWLCLILEERFGLSFHLEPEQQGLLLTLNDHEQGSIYFPRLEAGFHESRSDLPYTQWDAASQWWESALNEPLPAPGVAKLPTPLIEHQAEHAIIHYDILGLTYWMLNRIEEMGRTDLDHHGRFPAIHSHAYQHGYLERPVVDEWLHVLGQVIQKQWPQVELKQHQFSMKVSHDVDNPSLYAFKPWKTIIRMMVGHLLKRRDLTATLHAPWLKLTGTKQIPNQDPYNTFDWLMDISETNNLTSAFYFICGTTSNMDADYQLEDSRIIKLMQHMHARGHEIGLHPSYGTYQAPELIKKEADRLRTALQKSGIVQPKFGGRMHYLRWEHPTTLQAWNDVGMAYDSTLSYADRPGFRCGTCFEYPAFNPVTQKILQIRIRPLIVMECTVIDEVYLGLGITKAAQTKLLELKEKCFKLNGCFTLLWHNSYFYTSSELKKIYQRCIEG